MTITDRPLQKDIFLLTEADAWYERNSVALAGKSFSEDPICKAVCEFAESTKLDREPLSILEVGCGDGARLAWLAKSLGAAVYGIEPSGRAVEVACGLGVDAIRGTADSLPWNSSSFDIVIFGFCLYLCDPEDLFRIAYEADRVLKAESWLVLHDFFSPTYTQRTYHHKAGILSRKLDFRSLFSWHPAYTCYSHRVSAHGQLGFSDDQQEWVATSVLRKRSIDQG